MFSKRLISLILGALFIFSSGLVSSCASAPGHGDDLGLNPRWDWKTIETPHFRVTYPIDLQEPAQRVAGLYEEAWALIPSRLHWEPSGRTQVLLIDNADSANGLTTPIGGFGMVLYITPPDNWFSTAYTDDWLRMLVIHEYTHFVNMDTTLSFWGPLRWLLGDSVMPNSAWPAWMLEGLAVWMETRLSTGGRGRSTQYNRVLRKAVEEKVFDTSAFHTLDRINGDPPWNPSGETRYLFGYFLMNQLTEEELGRYSEASGRRIPYLNNLTLSSINGKSWQQLWDQWVAQATQHAEAELALIRSKPLTELSPLTVDGLRTLGSSFSPDGKFLAYSQETLHEKNSVWLRDLESGKARPLTEKVFGSSLAFTPDSREIVFSSLEKQNLYDFYSDLSAIHVKSGRVTRLSNGLRARDPDISRDGKKIVFAQTAMASIGLAWADLEHDDQGRLKLGTVQRLWTAPMYYSAHTPKFSLDGKKVFFSVHPYGSAREDLYEINLETGASQPIFAEGSFNRFPTLGPDGSLYFVSDSGGVDNIYRWIEPGTAVPMTRVTGGLAFPSISPAGQVVAASYASSGWDLVSLTLAPQEPLPLEGIGPLSAPDPAPSIPLAQTTYEEKDYSPWARLAPRQWAPYAYLTSSSGWYFGAQVLGFDTLEYHSYFAGAAWDTQVGAGDWFASYSYRQLGPTFTLSGEKKTNTSNADSQGLTDYSRKATYGLTIHRPIRWTHSILIPQLSIKGERLWAYVPGVDEPIYSSRYVPTIDVAFSFSNAERSTLAIASEGGRQTTLGARAYLGVGNEGGPVWKGLFKSVEYFRLSEHSVLSPAAKVSWTSRLSSYSPARVIAVGRVNRLFESMPNENFEEIAIRGYPGVSIFTRGLGKFSLDYRFPIARIYRGVDVHPVYANELVGFLFAEATLVPRTTLNLLSLPSMGGGIRFSTDWAYVFPIVFSLEYHQGTREDYGGRGEVFFHVGYSNFGF